MRRWRNMPVVYEVYDECKKGYTQRDRRDDGESRLQGCTEYGPTALRPRLPRFLCTTTRLEPMPNRHFGSSASLLAVRLPGKDPAPRRFALSCGFPPYPPSRSSWLKDLARVASKSRCMTYRARLAVFLLVESLTTALTDDKVRFV